MKKSSKKYESFIKAYLDDNLYIARKSAIFATVFYLLFLFLDAYLAEDFLPQIIIMRLAVSLLLALLIFLTYFEKFKQYWQHIFSLFVILGGVGIILMSHYLSCPPRTLYSQGLILVIIYGYTMNRLLLKPSAVAGLSITVIYFLVTLNSDEISHTAFIISLSLLLATNVFGIFNISYQQRLLFREYKLQQKNLNRTAKIKKLNTKLHLLAFTDGLTGIANRRILDEELDNLVKTSQSNRTPLSIIMLDIDYFKLYNDYYGHIKGDECLKKLASLLQHIVPSSTGTVARFGGEEFCVLLPNTKNHQAIEITKSIQNELQEKRIENHNSSLSHYVTASFGVVTAQQDNKFISAKEIILKVDECLYQAKEKGRNQINSAII